MLKVAIIGLGRIGRIHYNNIKSLDKLYKIIYLFDLNQELQPNFQESIFHPNKFIDIVKKNPIDAVFICSPTSTHFQLMTDSFNLGLHVFVEKPISLKKIEIEKVFDLADQKNCKLLVGFNRRFDPQIRQLRNNYKKGLLKNIQQILVISRDYPYPLENFIKISGGFFNDCVIHDLDNICWILGLYPNYVYSKGNITSEIGKKTNHLDNAITILEFPENILATLINSRIGDSYDQRIEFMGSNGSLKIENKNLDYSISFPEKYQESYVNEVKEFYLYVTSDSYFNESIPTKDQCLTIHNLSYLLEQSYLNQKRLCVD